MKKILLIMIFLSFLLLPAGLTVNAKEHFKLEIKQTISINQYGDFGIDENFTADLLTIFVQLFWKGDGTGILEILFNLIPILGNNPDSDALLYPLFLVLFTGGIYMGLKKQGSI